MIEKIREVWKNPFEAPVVIFPDSKMAQWFKFRWLGKNSALANLDIKNIDTFIFDSIVDKNEAYQLLTQDILRNLIIAYLEKKLEESSNEKIFDEIKDYLYDEEELNYARLFDFAEMLSSIFLEYEYSRVGDVSNNNGIIDFWLNNKDYFEPDSENAKIKEEWQKKIYFDIFSENGYLRQVNEKLKSDNEISGNYITLPQLFRKKLSEERNNLMGCSEEDLLVLGHPSVRHSSDTSPQVEALGKTNFNSVFIFGFDSMKLFYRNAVKVLSSRLNINIYLTNPFGDFTKENNNELLRYWGGVGKRNIELWEKMSDEFMSLDNNRNFSPKKDSLKIPLNPPLKKEVRRDLDINNNEGYLHLLQKAIVVNNDNIDYNSSSSQAMADKIDESLVMISAPTRLREVEILHSNICKLLLNKKAQIKNIIVASPNLDIYRSVIYQVFNQSSQKAEDNSSKNSALHIPFSIVDSSDNESLTHLALKRLFSLKEKGVLNRPDFFDLVRNPVVQVVRGILPDEIGNWEGWISSLNIYRDRELDDNTIERNWIKSVKSLLLAKLSNVAIDFSKDSIKPFSDIASSDNESVCRFIDCIEDIEEWLENEERALSSLDDAFNKIEKWLFMNKVPNGLGNENFIFQKIIKAKDELKWQYAASSQSIPWEIFSKTLLNASSKAKYNTGNLFVNGITFMNFVPDRIIPTKFMFLLGIDEKTFPRKDYKNSLDLRHEKPIDSDELNSEKDKYAFLNQLLNVKEAIYISYVNKDLQKDEDFYPSSVIDDILRYFKKLGKNLEIEKSFNVENRDWKELFTQSALRNKETYEMMMGRDNEGKTPSVSLPLTSSPNSFSNFGGASKDTYPERVTVYQLRSFLTEPFKARVERILSSEDEEDAEKIEFEPIEFDNLDNSKFRNELVFYCLKQNINTVEKLEEDLNKNIKDNTTLLNSFIDKLSLYFPRDCFGVRTLKDLLINVIGFVNNIKSKYNDNYTFCSEELSHELKLDDQSLFWTLSGDAKIIAKKDNEVHIIDLVNSGFYSNSYMNSYILALLYIVNNDSSNTVYIDLFNPNDEFECVPINCNSDESGSFLNKIYKRMFDNKYCKVLPIELFKEEKLDYHSYLNKFKGERGNPWRFFSSKNLFDVKEVCGFNEDNFEKEWVVKKKEQLELFPEELGKKILA
jgi:exodeoxyribonuclease V gamma subunit